MTPLRKRAAVALTATALFAAGAGAAFGLPSAFAASADDPTPPTAPPATGNTSPGTGDDAYKAGDPFVDNGSKPTNIPPGTVVAQSFQLFPTKLSATPGQRLSFDNRDIAIHDIQTLKGKIKVKSPDANPGKKVTFKAPKKPGTYKVGCFYHQSMRLKLVVKK